MNVPQSCRRGIPPVNEARRFIFDQQTGEVRESVWTTPWLEGCPALASGDAKRFNWDCSACHYSLTVNA